MTNTKRPAIIYLIKCKDESKKGSYVGSTLNYDARLCCHRRSSEISKKPFYEYIRFTGGWENWIMKPLAIITDWRTSSEYREVEKLFIKLYNTTYNINVPNRSQKEWKRENRDRIVFHNHTWRAKNPDKSKKYRNEYVRKNKEKMNNISKKWYKDNREKVLKLNNSKITCVCGCVIARFHLKNGNHKNTKKHHKLLMEKLKEGREKLKSNNLNINPLV